MSIHSDGFSALVDCGASTLKKLGVQPAFAKADDGGVVSGDESGLEPAQIQQAIAPLNQTLIAIAVIAGIFTAGYVIMELAKRNDEVVPQDDDVDALVERFV